MCNRFFAPSTCDACWRSYWLRAARAGAVSLSAAPSARIAANLASGPTSPPPPYAEVGRPDTWVPIMPLAVSVDVATGRRVVRMSSRLMFGKYLLF